MKIGVHLVTPFNGMNQSLKIFYKGFLKNLGTQEGLAVYREYMSDGFVLSRLSEL
jgi:hypothetical protein